MIPILIVAAFISLFLLIGYLVYRRVFRDAKGIERGLKMVPLLIHLPPGSDDTEVGSRDVREVIQEKVSQAEAMYSIIASTATKGFKSNFYGQRHIAFEIVGHSGVVNFYAFVPVALTELVKQAILSSYPTAQLEEVEEHNIFSQTGKIAGTTGGELTLSKEYPYPIATASETKRDAMQSILNALANLGEEDGAAIQLLIRPAKEGWDKRSKDLVAKTKKNKGKGGGLASGGVKALIAAPFKPPEASDASPEDKQLTSLEQSVIDAVEQKTTHPGYETLIRLIASSNTANRSQSILHNLLASFSFFEAQGRNGFKFNAAKDIQSFVTAYIFRMFPPQINKNILNSVELASIFHFPDQQFSVTSQLQRQSSKQVDGPHNIPKDGILMGHNVFRGVKKEVRLSIDDRRRHVYVIGQTGTGKSVLLENLALQDMMRGNGFAFIDPHGDTAETLMSLVPKERTEDVIYFNPGDTDFPLGLNLFEHKTPEQKDFLIQEAINMLYKLYDPGHTGIIGPRYEHWFRNAALTLMSDPKGSTFIEIPKVFTDKQYAKEKLKHVTDPTVLDFWNKEMAQTSDYHKSEVLGWFVSKFGAFMSNEMMRNIIGQTKSSFDLREIMDQKKILIVNLSKGKVGELNSKLLGMIFVMKFQAAAMSRANVPQEERADFSLYVDEFQNFSTDSFATILSEARKYRLNLLVANQFMGQLTDEIRDAVFGNVGTIISLRSGAADSDFLVKQFSPVFDTQDLVKLPNYNSIVRLMVGGVPTQPFSMVTIPPLGNPNPKLAQALKQLSAAKFGKPRALVEKDIFSRLETKTPASPLSKPQRKFSRSAPNKPQRTAQRSSFLDDWLAKRKIQQNQQGSKQVDDAISKTASSTPGAPPPSASNINHTLGDSPSESALSPAEPSSSSDNTSSNQIQPAQRSPLIQPIDKSPIKEPPSVNELNNNSPTVSSAQAEQAGEPDQDVGKSLVGTDDDVDKIADVLKDQLGGTDQASKESSDTNQNNQAASEQGEANSTANDKVKNLQPGEIFVDEDGKLYQGSAED